MKYTNYLYGIGLLLLNTTAGAQEQTAIYGNRITIRQSEPLEQQGDSLPVAFLLDAGGLKIESCRSLTLTPMIAGEKDTLRLQPIVFNGRNRHQVYRRNLSLGEEDPQTYYAVVKMTGKEEKTVAYRRSVLFAPWMNDARLVIEENLCGCGGHTQQTTCDPLFAVIAPVPLVEEPFRPAYAYLQPAPEKVKNRTELKDIYLNFPVNKTVIYPEYMNNPAELTKAQKMIEGINSDKNLSIREVLIKGYASPEGSVASNHRLSEGRAAALKNYLVPRLHTPSLPIRSESGGEDWEGVIELLPGSDITGRDELLAAIRKGDRSDAAEQALRTLDGGQPYREMLQQIYPKVRRVLCSVSYTVREFTLEESREIIRLHPEQLSVEEMYRVAESYPEDSDEFKEALRTAARVFPADETARLNAAVIELQEGNYDKAATLLDGIRQSNAAYENACGLLAVQREAYEQAAAHFRKAVEGGSDAARQNLSELEKKQMNKQKNND
ncbi:MAG: DUF3868 domain-containing protein [Parabacteroides gordonii]|nr:DUF3868 domain-containing protein [Parabacteroides gordonii]